MMHRRIRKGVPMRLATMLLLTATALVAATACKSVRAPSPQPSSYPSVDLPRDFKNADLSPALDKSAVVVSILESKHAWVGLKEYLRPSDYEQIENAVRQAPQKIVYVRADGALDYVTIVNAIFAARKGGALEFALQVRMGTGPDRQFTIKVSPPPPDTFSEKNDPALVGVILSADSKISLVKGGLQDGPVGPGGAKEDIGTLSDISRLAPALTQTVGDRTDRKVTIKAFRGTRYNEVMTIIDAVKGARANPIVLQIDDLP